MTTLTSREWRAVRTPPYVNQNYLAVIACNDKNITVIANLPQEFSMDLGASYEEAFSQGLAGLLSGNGMLSEIAGKSLKMLGLQLTTKALTAQVWQGSTEISFTLPLIFQVESDSEADIQKPLRDLYSLVLPEEKEAGGLLEAPGPRVDLAKLKKAAISMGSIASETGGQLQSAWANNQGNLWGMAQAAQSAVGGGLRSFSNAFLSAIKNNISLSIGDRMLFKSVVITSVAQNFAVQPLEDGVFQRVECTVGFKTFYVLTQQDMPDLFSPGAFNYTTGGGGGASSNASSTGGGGTIGSVVGASSSLASQATSAFNNPSAFVAGMTSNFTQSVGGLAASANGLLSAGQNLVAAGNGLVGRVSSLLG